MPTKPKKKIVYIIGLGRSGTTLVDIVLGNGYNMFSCGEVNRYPLRRGIRRVASSSDNNERGEFWDKIRRRLESTDARFANYERLQRLHWRYEYHLGYMRDRMLGLKESTDLHEYYAFLNHFYATLFEESGVPILVDSSKYSGRAWHLSRALPPDEYEINYVFLRRHPVSVVRSFQKKGTEQRSKSWLGANLRYFVINHICSNSSRFLARDHTVVQIDYEDLAGNPIDCLTYLEQTLDIDLARPVSLISKGQPLIVGNLFDGNRIRHQGQLLLQAPAPIAANTLGERLVWLFNRRIYQDRDGLHKSNNSANGVT